MDTPWSMARPYLSATQKQELASWNELTTYGV